MKLIRKYAPHELVLDDNQDDELSELVSVIESNGKRALQDVFDEAEVYNVHKAVKQAWDIDVLRLRERKQFVTDQRSNGEKHECILGECIIEL